MKKIILPLFLVLLLAGMAMACGNTDAMQKQIVKLQKENTSLQAKIRMQQEMITAMQAKLASLEKKSSNVNPNANPKVLMKTNRGEIIIELNKDKAPITVANFLKYTNNKFFDGLVFHRVMSNFMIQGGGFNQKLVQKKPMAPIKNEASNGLKNDRGTIAMARTNNPNSATSQFFINVKNNDMLNYSRSNPGYAVFGKVVKGMDVVDKIRLVKTTKKMLTALNGTKYQSREPTVPVENVVIESVTVIK